MTRRWTGRRISGWRCRLPDCATGFRRLMTSRVIERQPLAASMIARSSAMVDPRFVELNGAGSEESFVVSQNLHRRHLNESQRAMVAARSANISRGGDRSGIKAPIGALITTTEASQMLNVGTTSLDRAKVVLRGGSPEGIRDVESGDRQVSRVAAEILKRERRGAQIDAGGEIEQKILARHCANRKAASPR